MNYWGLGLGILGWLVLAWSGGYAAQTHTEPDYAVEVAALQAQLLALAENYAAGSTTVETQVRQTFMAFEASALDQALAARKPALYRQMERQLLGLRDLAQQKISNDVFQREVQGMVDLLSQGARALAQRQAPLTTLLQALMIILREGFEALLILAALSGYLRKLGQTTQLRYVRAGGGAAVLASVLTALLLGALLQQIPASRELLEGITMLIAVPVLFYVSYWLISKTETHRWQTFLQDKVQGSLAVGGGWALALVAFLAVYREGFETILFYQALAAQGQATSIWAGLALGLLALMGAWWAFGRFGQRLPLRPFFITTSALLYFMAFRFTGAGLQELQEGGLRLTNLPWMPRWDWLQDWFQVYPYRESLAIQGILLLALGAALLYTFWGKSNTKHPVQPVQADPSQIN